MQTLKFNRLHKNGWVSFKLAGVQGAVFVDRKMFEEGKIPTEGTIEVNIPGLKAEGAGAVELDAEKAAAKLAKDTAKAEKAEASAKKAQERLEKLKAQVEKANAAVAKAAGGTAVADAPAAESVADPSSL
jgi:hypothetical protein